MEDKIQKLTKFVRDKELAIFDELSDLNEKIDGAVEALKPLQNLDLSELDAIEGAMGERGEDGKDGYTPQVGIDFYTPEEIEAVKREVTPLKGVDYFDGIDGEKGEKGDKGDKGEDGKDGSPDTAEQVRDKLATLKGDARLDKKSIKGLDSYVDEKVKYVAMGYSGVKDIVAGSGVTASKDGNNVVTLTATGSGLGDVTGPSSSTDNAIARFDSTTGKIIQNSAATIADTTGDITAGKYNTVAISGSSTPTLAVTGTTAVSGNNSGDQVADGVTITGAGTVGDPFVAVTGGSGDVVGPASAVDSNFAAFDTTTGKLIKDSGVTTASFAAALTADQNYVSDAELTVIQNTSGTNTGDSASLPIGGGTLTGGLTLVTGTTIVEPIKFVAGVVNTTPVAGVLEFDGTNLFISI